MENAGAAQEFPSAEHGNWNPKAVRPDLMVGCNLDSEEDVR